MTSLLVSRSRRTASIRSGRAGGLAGKLASFFEWLFSNVLITVPNAQQPCRSEAIAVFGCADAGPQRGFIFPLTPFSVTEQAMKLGALASRLLRCG